MKPLTGIHWKSRIIPAFFVPGKRKNTAVLQLCALIPAL
jgi:hypothetical protein